MQRNTIRENIEIFIVTIRIALSVINYCYGIRRVNGIRRHRLTILVMADHRWADQAEEEHCTTPSGARGARPRQPKRRKIVTSPLSDTARRLLVVKCSAADQQQAATAPSIDNSFVLPASQPTPSVIRDMVGNQFPQLHVEEGTNSEWRAVYV